MGLFAVGLLCLQVLFRLEEYEMKISSCTHARIVTAFALNISSLFQIYLVM
jgi:hypothetical protein